ncbi:MAG TPA: endonuclease domain-containing protein [Ignavibacteriaceae bacterium]
MEPFNENLHQHANGRLYEYGRILRQRQTEAEEKLWHLLRNRKLNGLKFRRQHPLDKYIADFYCHEKRLAIELDGGIHKSQTQREIDDERTSVLNRIGITVLRFKNEEVFNNSKVVTDSIIKIAERLSYREKH